MRTWLRRWWWLSLVILGVLLVKAAFVGSWVSGIARDEAAAAADIPVERVEVDGLDITLVGFTDEGERDAAVAAVDALASSERVIGLMARSGTGDDRKVDDSETGDDASASETGVGDTPTSDIRTDESGTGGSEAAGDGDDDPAPGLPAAVIDLALDVDGTVTLQGVVSSEQARADVLALAETHFGRGTIIDELTVDEGTVGPTGGTLVVGGKAPSDAKRAEWFASANALANGLGYELSDGLVVATVADTLNDLFALQPIEFDTLRATLRPSAQATLDEAVALINDHPVGGNLLVVGHTDSDGRATRNLDLSERRAQAVIDYLVSESGVDPTRLRAKGVGEEQLLVSPERTANDKRRNRRIEWELSP